MFGRVRGARVVGEALRQNASQLRYWVSSYIGLAGFTVLTGFGMKGLRYVERHCDFAKFVCRKMVNL